MASIISEQSNLLSYDQNFNTNQKKEDLEISESNLEFFDLLIENRIFFNKNEIYLFAILNYLEKYINPSIQPNLQRVKPIITEQFKKNLSSLNLELVMKTYNFSVKNLDDKNQYLNPFYKHFAENSRFILFKYLAKYLNLTVPLKKIIPESSSMDYIEVLVDGKKKRFKIPIRN